MVEEIKVVFNEREKHRVQIVSKSYVMFLLSKLQLAIIKMIIEKG